MFGLVLLQLCCEFARFAIILFRLPAALAAENIALRSSGDVCVRCRHPRRHLDDAKKVTLVVLDRVFGIRHDLPLLSPATIRRWARKVSTYAFWLRSHRRTGRRPVHEDAVAVIRQLASENLTWSAGKIARTASTQLGIRVSPNTVRKYLPLGDPRRRRARRPSSESWSTFVRNHADGLLAIDFAVSRTLLGGILYILVVMEIGSRRIIHANVTAHPTAQWTVQQLREAVHGGHAYTHLIHDNDAIFSRAVDATIRSFGIEPLRTPIRAPRANAFCERLIGTLRRDCLDHIIPLSEMHLRSIVREWMPHYNRARPHMALGGSVPEPNALYPATPQQHRHELPSGAIIISKPVLGGLHHEYRLEAKAA
jgi:putative transposase